MVSVSEMVFIAGGLESHWRCDVAVVSGCIAC
jgi:hypothetical protein